MKVRREAIPYALFCGATAAFLVAFGQYYFSMIPFFFFLFVLFFFRDPDRGFSGDPEAALSPADGKVIKIKTENGNHHVSIFMSIFNVHINRSPVEGKIIKREYFQGSYLAAYNDKASLENERLKWVIESRFGLFECTQIAGLVARRIHPLKREGETVPRGGEFGLIAFGSRVDMIFPGDIFELSIKVGDKVKSGLTPIATRKKLT
jgi:phosphatidylserine decarboxylase